jgi:RNA polymerase sigma-70 factor
MPSETTQHAELLAECEPVMDEIFARCTSNWANFGVSEEVLKNSLKKSVQKYLFSSSAEAVSAREVENFLRQIKADDLFLALACAGGNERAWWEFDHQYRAYLERIADNLASAENDAQDVIDTVYIELYGTRVIDGERISKFATYSGRGSMRGWLRTVMWHALVDLHRASHDEVSLDELTEETSESYAHSTFTEEIKLGGEDEMIDKITKDRYRKATLNAIENAFAALDAHEKLLLLYYHVENMKLREIAKLVESPASPLRGWFQRKTLEREKNPESRIHESTISRWLEKSYAKVLEIFRTELLVTHSMSENEVEICMELATQDLTDSNLYRNLTAT